MNTSTELQQVLHDLSNVKMPTRNKPRRKYPAKRGDYNLDRLETSLLRLSGKQLISVRMTLIREWERSSDENMKDVFSGLMCVIENLAYDTELETKQSV